MQRKLKARVEGRWGEDEGLRVANVCKLSLRWASAHTLEVFVERAFPKASLQALPSSSGRHKSYKPPRLWGWQVQDLG